LRKYSGNVQKLPRNGIATYYVIKLSRKSVGIVREISWALPGKFLDIS